MKKLSKKARTAIISTVAVVLVAAIAGTSGYLTVSYTHLTLPTN